MLIMNGFQDHSFGTLLNPPSTFGGTGSWERGHERTNPRRQISALQPLRPHICQDEGKRSEIDRVTSLRHSMRSSEEGEKRNKRFPR